MNNNKNDIQTNKSTTVVGIKNQDSVVIAADRQVSGYREREMDKIEKVHPRGILGAAGLVRDIQNLMSDIKNHSREYKIRRGRNIDPKSLNEYIENTVKTRNLSPEYLVNLVYVGYESEPFMTNVTEIGTTFQDGNFTAIGSGSSEARGVMDLEYQSDMSQNEIKQLAVKAIRTASNMGVFTGLGIDVGVVNESGIEISSEPMDEN